MANSDLMRYLTEVHSAVQKAGLSALSQRRPAIFAVGEARLLQVEIAFDPPPDLVGDLAVAQQDVDEFPLRRNQLSRQFHPRG